MLKNLFDSLSDGVIGLHPDGSIQVMNTAAEKFFRCRSKDWLGHPLWSIYSPFGDDDLRMRFKKALDGDAQNTIIPFFEHEEPELLRATYSATHATADTEAGVMLWLERVTAGQFAERHFPGEVDLREKIDRNKRAGMLLVDASLQCSFVSAEAAKILGLPICETCVTSWTSFIPEHHRKTILERWKQRALSKKTFVLEAPFEKEDQLGWIRWSTAPVARHLGEDLFVCVLEDITDQKLQVDRNIQQDVFERKINEFAASLLKTTVVEEILDEITRNAIDSLQFVDCVIYLLDEGSGKLIQRSALGVKGKEIDEDQAMELHLGEGIVGSVAQSGISEIVADSSSDKRYLVDDEIRYSEIAVPIKYEGKVIGVIDSEHPERNFFTHTHLAVLENIADLCANRLMRVLTEDRIRNSEEQLQLALQGGSLDLWDLDVRMQVVSWSRSERNGHKSSSIALDVWMDQIHPNDREHVSHALDAHLAGRADVFEEEYRVRTVRGSWSWVLNRAKAVAFDDENKPLRVTGTMLDVSESRMTKERLTRYNALLAAQLDASLDGILVADEDEMVVMKNARFDQIWQAETIGVGHFLGDLWGHCNERLQGPKDVKQHLTKPLEGKAEATYKEIVLKNGKTLEHYCSRIESSKGKHFGWIWYYRDITYRKQAELSIEQHRVNLKALIENTTDMVWSVDQDLRLLTANEPFINWIEALIGRKPQKNEYSLYQELSEKTKQLWKEHYQTVLAGNSKKFEHTTTLNGRETIMECSLNPIRGKRNKVIGISAFDRDITQRKKTETELRNLTDELLHSNTELKQFAYITSHNLRAPVVNLDSLMGLLNRDNLLDPDNEVILEKIDTSIVQLSATLDDLVKIVSIKNEVNQPRDKIVMEDMLAAVMQSIGGQIENANAKVEWDFTKAPIINYPKTHINSILLNFLTNALKYAAPNRQPHITLSTSLVGKYIRLTVSDNGIGIDLARHGDKLFGMYRRFHDHIEGKGLGLYIIRSQVEAMGGRVEVSSVVGQGTTFKVYLRK